MPGSSGSKWYSLNPVQVATIIFLCVIILIFLVLSFSIQKSEPWRLMHEGEVNIYATKIHCEEGDSWLLKFENTTNRLQKVSYELELVENPTVPVFQRSLSLTANEAVEGNCASVNLDKLRFPVWKDVSSGDPDQNLKIILINN